MVMSATKGAGMTTVAAAHAALGLDRITLPASHFATRERRDRWMALPPLAPTEIVDGRAARIHRMPPGPQRARERSRTFEGIAAAMAHQWGDAVLSLARTAHGTANQGDAS
jgi:hypothetical protein